MKRLDDFLNEKAEMKREAEQKPAPTKRKSELPDDKKYFALMSEYKKMRLRDKEEANKILQQLMDLDKQGNVSPEARLGAAYL